MYSSSVIHSILVASLVTASSSLIIKNLNSRESYSLVGREVCSGFAGNSDLYGLGIRLGIYLQWISSLLTNSLLPTTVSDLLDTNSIFLFAVFIAIAVATNLPGGLHPVEAFIMLQLCFGFLLSVLSVNGSKLILFNDAHGLDPERILFRLRRTPDTGHRMDRDMLYEFPFVRNRELIGTPTSGPPSGVTVPPLQGLFLRYIDTLAIYSISSGVISGRYGSIMIYSMELNLLVTDLIVFLCMSFDTAHETHDEPVEAYRQERLLDYKNKHKLPMEYQNAKLFSLGLTSPYKNDQVSWLGVFWRSCLVAGIGVYNVWFWIVGIKLLTTDSCPAYIFLLCKARILGPAGTLFKFMSVVYMIYAGGLIITACYSMLAFLGTTLRSLLINLFIMPYTKLLLIIASAGSDGARRTLESFGETRSQCLQWLDIPNVRQLLSAFVYLSSNPKEATIAENINPNEKPAMSYWAKILRNLFLLISLAIFVWTILAVELTLFFNSVSGVYSIKSTGQLIPFIIGVFGVSKTVNSIMVRSIKELYPSWPRISISVTERNRVIIRDLAETDDNPNLSNENETLSSVPLRTVESEQRRPEVQPAALNS